MNTTSLMVEVAEKGIYNQEWEDPLPILTVHEDLDRVAPLLAQPIEGYNSKLSLPMFGATKDEVIYHNWRCYIIGFSKNRHLDQFIRTVSQNSSKDILENIVSH